MSDQIHQFYNQMTLGHNDYNERKQGKGEGIMKKKVLGTALAFILGMSVLTGCGNSTAEANSKDASASASTSSEATEKTGELNKTDHLNIALQPIPGYLPVTVLQDKGWLEEALAEAGYDPDFGARPVKRAIQRDVLNALSKQLLAGAVSKDKDITIDSKDGEIVFRN
jgi:hypothetical protein